MDTIVVEVKDIRITIPMWLLGSNNNYFTRDKNIILLAILGMIYFLSIQLSQRQSIFEISKTKSFILRFYPQLITACVSSDHGTNVPNSKQANNA